MLKRVVITNYLGESVEYKIEGVDAEDNNGLFITEIEGLGPPDADLIFTKMVNIDGSIYNFGRINGRNIVIKARFLYAKTIEEARLQSYRFFHIKKPLMFQIETDNRKVYTVGYVEKNEPNIFSNECDIQVSIMCEDAFFKDVNDYSEESFSAIEPLFEFVYENEGFEPVTEFGNKGDKTVVTITNNGDIEVGYTITLRATGEVSNPSINFISTGESLTFDTDVIAKMSGGKQFDNGDEIILTMLDRTKNCYFYNSSTGQYVNILNLVDQDFSWPKLTPGPTNMYHVSADYGEDYLRVYIDYQALYEGV
jgi:hypothetical protein